MTAQNELKTAPLLGATLAWREYGAADGFPVVYHHGWPSSSVQAAHYDAEARSLGLRIISPDRPGLGGSAARPGRALLDWPPLLAALLDHLGIAQCALVGVSGGGPYTCAAAWALHERVKAAAIVCGAPHVAALPDLRGLLPLYRTLLAVHRTAPGLSRLVLKMGRPFTRVPPPRWLQPAVLAFVPEPDRSVMSDPAMFAFGFETVRGAWGGARDGVFDDAHSYAEPWGFDPAEIRCPFHVWHGREDAHFSWQLSESLAAQVPGATLRILDGEGHHSIAFRRGAEILGDLRNAVQ